MRFTAVSAPGPATSAALMQQVRRLISRRKGVGLRHVRPGTDLPAEFGFGALDMVDLIRAVEHHFDLLIPDEVLLRTPHDFVRFLHERW